MDLSWLNDIFASIDSYVGGSQWFVFLLLGTGLFFTIYLGFPQIRFFRHALRIISGKFDKKDTEGDTSHFQALSTALSGTVGTGNIAGVAFAIYLGGPGAIFWMLVTAFLGMTTKFVEVTLSHKYREKAEDGTMSGGPMYYMKNKLNMKWLAVMFAVATIISSFGTGNLPQVNSISSSLFSTFGIDKVLSGGILAILLGFVILGGISRIAKVTSRLVPTMAVFYIIGALAVLIFNYQNVIPAFASIFTSVFSGSAAVGGFLGASIMFAFNRGVNRGLFSNEAGQGSAPIAHASAKAKHPVSEGMVSILEPFIDTIIICTITGTVILSSGVWNEKFENDFSLTDVKVFSVDLQEDSVDDKTKLFNHLIGEAELPLYSGEIHFENGNLVDDASITFVHARSFAEEVKMLDRKDPYTGDIEVKNGDLINLPKDLKLSGKSLIHSAPLTSKAFTRSHFGKYGEYIVTIGLLLFAFSTAISWSYYGGRAVTFLWGVKSVKYFRIVYVLGFFLASFVDTTIVWTFSGIAIALMTLPNLFGILLLRKDMKASVKDYWEQFYLEHPEYKKKK